MSSHSLNRAPALVLLSLIVSLLLAGRSLAGASPTAVVPSAASSPVNLDEVSHLGSFVNAVTVRDNLAYVGEESRLAILDIAHADRPPVLIGKSAPTGDLILDIAVSGDLAFLAGGETSTPAEGSLRIVDISQPAHPVEIGAVVTPTTARGVVLSGDYAFVVTTYHDLRVIHIADPTRPVEVAALAIPGSTSAIALVDHYAYIAAGMDGLQVIDIANPLRPVIAGSLDTTSSVHDVAVDGRYAYLADQDNGLRIVDISDPVAPVSVSSIVLSNAVRAITVDGQYAYVSGFIGRVQIVNIADPAAPVKTGVLEPGIEVAVAGSLVYVAAGSTGLLVYRVTDPTAPQALPAYEVLGYTNDLAMADGLAYLTTDTGLLILDVTDPNRPVRRGQVDTPVGLRQIILAGDYAYTTSEFSRLLLFDIVDPDAPQQVTTLNLTSDVINATVDGSVLYVITEYDGLQLYDVADPLNPILRSSYQPPTGVWSVTAQDGIAYLLNDDYNLDILDATDPAAPQRMGFFNTGGTVYEVLVDGPIAYLSDSASGLRLLDIDDPANPVEVGAGGDSRQIVAMARDSAFLYTVETLPAEPYSLVAYNVADPTRPTVMGYGEFDGLNGVSDLEAVNEVIGMLSFSDGLTLLRYTGPRTVAGRITLSGGLPLPGATVWAGPAHTITGSDGRYYLFDVPPGDHVIRPALAGYTFDPPQTAVSLPPDWLDIDFTATPWLESWSSQLPAVARP